MPKVGEQPREVKAMSIGIDPGASGGIVAISSLGGRVVQVDSQKMPDTPLDLYLYLSRFQNYSQQCEMSVWIELITGYVPKIGKADPSSTAFKQGRNYGHIEMCLIAMQVPYNFVTPGVWQKNMGVAKKGKEEKKEEFKRRLKIKAQQLYPSHEWTLKTCDAYLIAEYGRMKYAQTWGERKK